MEKIICEKIKESIDVKKSLLENKEIIKEINNVAFEIINTLKNNGKIVLCGNGGSASDALHFAGEIVGRFQKERNAWPAIVLNADVTTMTAIANDYGYEDIFSRQAEAHLNEGDIFIGISTSGNSQNIVQALEVAKKKKAKTIGLLGKDGGILGKKVDYPIIIPYSTTARIQECHIMIIHILCEIIENELSKV